MGHSNDRIAGVVLHRSIAGIVSQVVYFNPKRWNFALRDSRCSGGDGQGAVLSLSELRYEIREFGPASHATRDSTLPQPRTRCVYPNTCSVDWGDDEVVFDQSIQSMTTLLYLTRDCHD